MGRGKATGRQLIVLLAAAATLIVAGGGAQASPAPTARPTPITVPGGLRPDSPPSGHSCLSDGVCTLKPGLAGSCTGYSSQTSPPATIRVLVGGGTASNPTYTITRVGFEQYVENVLPDEWLASWDGDALKAGAVAVKSYAWYWVTHYGGYVGRTHSASTCFDVTDDTNFQVYRAGSATTRTTHAVQATWPVAARINGRVLQASYRAYLHSSSEACGAYANGTTVSQYGTQACNQASSGNKYNVILAKYYYPGLQLSTARQRRTPDDFTFEQTSTRAVFAAGTWSIDDGYPTTFRFGIAGDLPAITDAGDGFAHIGVWRPSTGYWYQASPTGSIVKKTLWGVRGDIPVAAHYSGVSSASVLAVFRPSSSNWYVRGSASVHYGVPGDIPTPGHYAGSAANDYRDQIAVFRPDNGTWYVRGGTPVHYGTRGDIPVPGDYDGNGTTDLAVYRPATHTFYVRGSASVVYGTSGDIPVTGDYDGNGTIDLAVYRPSTHRWYVHAQAARTFGSSGATPIGAAPLR